MAAAQSAAPPTDEEGKSCPIDNAALAEEIMRGDLPRRSIPLLLSGAADGADTMFGKAALSAGQDVAHFLGPGNEPSAEAASSEQQKAIINVDEKVIYSETIAAALESAAKTRLTPLPEKWHDDWKTSSRNFLQVRRVDAVYCVCYRQPADDPPLDIGGGTGFSAQFYVDRFRDVVDARSGLGGEPAENCKLYLYDDGSKGWPGCKCVDATWHKWNVWDVRARTWVPLDGAPPAPTGVWAGIGGTRVSPDGERAINELFAPPA